MADIKKYLKLGSLLKPLKDRKKKRKAAMKGLFGDDKVNKVKTDETVNLETLREKRKRGD